MQMDPSVSFGELLRRYRRAAGLTQEELAERAGLSCRGINDLERGARRHPRRDTIVRLAEAFALTDDQRAAFEAARLAPAAYQDARVMPTLDIHLLGDFRLVYANTSLSQITAPRLQALLAYLALYRAAPQSCQHLAFLLWPDTNDAQARPNALLLILDNCEHLIETCAQLAEILLRAAPNLCILASSREPFGITGETAYRVPPLALPDIRQSHNLDALAQNDCVRLFVERAAAAYPPFRLTTMNTPTIAQIGRRLDGIPLAIELAAARTKVVPPEQIAARLDDRFRLLTGGSRTALPRHQTLLALIQWSHNLLTTEERVLLRRLSVFAGSWSLEHIRSERCAAGPRQTDGRLHFAASSAVCRRLRDTE